MSRTERAVVLALVAGSVAGGAFAGCHPTGTRVIDPLYAGLLAGLLTAASARSSRGVLLAASVVGVAMSRRWLWVPAFAGLGVAFAQAFRPAALLTVDPAIQIHPLQRSRPIAGAVTGALLAQVMLRWPPVAFLGATAAVAALVTVLVLGSAWRTMPRSFRRWTLALVGLVAVAAVYLSSLVIVSSREAKRAIDSGIAHAKSALADIQAGHAPAAVDDLRVASQSLGSAYATTSLWSEAAAAAVPFLAQQQRVVLDVTRSARSLTSSAANEAGSVDFHNLAYRNGGIDLASIRAIAAPVTQLDDQLIATQAVERACRSQWLVRPLVTRLDSLDGYLTRARRTTDLAEQGVTEAPILLGGSGAKNYLVVFMTPAETRGLGGFLGAYAVVSAKDGRVTLHSTGRLATLSPPPGAPKARISGPLDWVERYGGFSPQTDLEDLSYSPDFPADAQVISQLFPQMQAGARIDGVLALDPYALQALLQFTGPIMVPGFPQPLTTSDAADIILRQQYLADTNNQANDARHDVLAGALAAGFEKLTTGSLPAPSDLSSALDPEVRHGRLLFWSPDPAVQPLLQRLGLLGGFAGAAASDNLLSVTVDNAANDKIDAYLHERLRAAVTYHPADGRVDERLSIRLTNAAPASGLPDYVIGSFPGSGLPAGTNYTWLTVYSPYDLASASLDGRPVAFEPPIPEDGVPAYSAYIRIPPSSTVTLTVNLTGTTTPGPMYHMAFWLQPLAHPVDATVTLAPVGAWQPTPVWVVGQDAAQFKKWVLSTPPHP